MDVGDAVICLSMTHLSSPRWPTHLCFELFVDDIAIGSTTRLRHLVDDPVPKNSVIVLRVFVAGSFRRLYGRPDTSHCALGRTHSMIFEIL